MRAVVQRVSESSVKVGGKTIGEIGRGLLVLLGVEVEDSEQDADYIAKKIGGLRIFDDDDGLFNRSVHDVTVRCSREGSRREGEGGSRNRVQIL